MRLSEWHNSLNVALSVVAFVGGAIVGIQLIFALGTIRGRSSMAFGDRAITNPQLSITLAVLTVVLLAIGLVGTQGRFRESVAALIGLTGTLISGYGLLRGGSAGPIFALYWWVLLVVAVLAAASAA